MEEKQVLLSPGLMESCLDRKHSGIVYIFYGRAKKEKAEEKDR